MIKLTNKNIFEVAAKDKLRFSFKGLITVEDLFDLNVADLDSIFKKLNSELKQVTEESLLDIRTEQDAELALKIEIVKHIVDVKLVDAELKLRNVERNKQKQEVLRALSSKENEDLQNKSAEELREILQNL